MKIVFFAHPDFMHHQSMPRYSNMLAEGMKSRGHKVDLWFPNSHFSKLSSKPTLKKWLGYLDQYIIFPIRIKKLIKNNPKDTLYVLTDHALGPWVPLVKEYPHVIHCHDFLAQRSALGEIPENRIGWTGKRYQSFIRKGFTKGKNFISISEKTRIDLHRFLANPPSRSEMVYNGLNQNFSLKNVHDARILISKITNIRLQDGYLLHVGGNHFYKNRPGVIDIYDEWRKLSKNKYDLLMIGELPDSKLINRYNSSPFRDNIHFLSHADDNIVRTAYSGALILIFPSLAEGFGWPIAEAMASGCPVITSNDSPMSEVAGEAAFFIPVKPFSPEAELDWSVKAGGLVEEILNFPPAKRDEVISKGIENSKKFNPDKMLDRIEVIYRDIITDYSSAT
jgi:glycosyltransferase involved in cell wall biosynthesis